MKRLRIREKINNVQTTVAISAGIGMQGGKTAMTQLHCIHFGE